MANPGRKHELTKEHVETLVRVARLMPKRRWHLHVGKDAKTVKNWMRRGKANAEGDDPIFHDMYVRVMAARLNGETDCLESIEAHGDPDGRAKGNFSASAWLLERSFGYHKDTPEDTADTPDDIGGQEAAISALADSLPEAILEAALAKKRG